MTEHLGAAPGEQTKKRRGYRNGSYKRKLTSRVGTLELEVPRDREGTFKTESLSAISATRRRSCWRSLVVKASQLGK